jgi:hypothetical protein
VLGEAADQFRLAEDGQAFDVDAANVLQRDVDDALVPIVEELEKAAGINPLAMFEAQEGSAN